MDTAEQSSNKISTPWTGEHGVRTRAHLPVAARRALRGSSESRRVEQSLEHGQIFGAEDVDMAAAGDLHRWLAAAALIRAEHRCHDPCPFCHIGLSESSLQSQLPQSLSGELAQTVRSF